MEHKTLGKKVFITGISSGIGRALATKLVDAGLEVWGLARRKNALEELQKNLGDKLTISICDITNSGEMEKLATEMRQRNFWPDVVVLNAAVQPQDVQDSFHFDNARQAFRTNLEGSLFWISEFLPDFLKKRQGLFIAISSTSAHRPSKNFIAYPSSKAALSMAFRGLRLNFKKSGVGFSTIHFGPIATKMWQGKVNFLVPSANQAAQFIISTFHKTPSSYFFPFLSTSMLRITKFLPDKLFNFISSLLKK
ncbi:MAG: oxidoreductase, short chain dehydrogenase [Parcubacteria group bacterium Gr01-1014_44]|nr:MAG: oxidoreductase, short chain dehydrogenase [Parcubacteria group bacterium Gr01-1014_44]